MEESTGSSSPFWAARQHESGINVPRTVLTMIICYIVWTYLHSIFFHPLRIYPGPKLAAASRIPYWIACLSGRSVPWIQNLHIKYGVVVRYSPNELSYTGAQAWKDIYGYQRGRNENPKDLKFYTPSKNGAPSLAILDVEEHTKIRRAIAPAFSDRALKQQEPLFRRFADLLISNLRKAVTDEPGTAVNMVKMYNFTTFDIMAELTYGESLGLLEKSEYTPWVDLVFKSISVIPLIQITEYYPILKRLFEMLEPESLKKIRVSHHKHSADRLNKRLAKGSNQPDIWNLVTAEGNESKDVLLTVPQMQSNAELFMTAGTETTATLLSGLTYLLLVNPDKLQTLVAEIRGAYASDTDIDFDSLARLKYLNACIEEGLRMYPPIPSAFLRITPEGGNVILGKWVAPGTSVSVHTTSSYRDPNNFRHPNSFIPERWLGNEEYQNDKRDARQPFSVGPRNCLGMGMAWHEIRLIMAKILYNFDLELCQESRDWLDQKVFILWQKKPLMCRLIEARSP